MYQRSYITILLIFFLGTMSYAGGEPSLPFEDGRWSGDIEPNPNSSGFGKCWAKTHYDDGTTLTLAKQDDGRWYLRLSNAAWQLPAPHQYDMIALVDFHPQFVRAAALAVSETVLEIENLDQISLLKLIENGHTIDLSADGFHKNYDLEGSAKVIQRIRNCFADHS